jgi:hypothetical protein
LSYNQQELAKRVIITGVVTGILALILSLVGELLSRVVYARLTRRLVVPGAHP